MGILAFLIGCIGLLIADQIVLPACYQAVSSCLEDCAPAGFRAVRIYGCPTTRLIDQLTAHLELGRGIVHDICVSVLQVARRPDHGYVVTVQIRNAGRGRTQRPDHLAFRIVDRVANLSPHTGVRHT